MSDQHRPGTTAETILSLNEFDRKLRNLLFEALAVFETKFRASVAYHAVSKNPYLHLDGIGLSTDFTSKLQQDGQSKYTQWHIG